MAPENYAPTLGEIVTLVRGTTYKSALLDQPGPVLLGLASIQRNGGFRDDSLKTYGGDSKPHQLLVPGDLYVSLKDVTQSADLLGAVARLPDSIKSGRLTQDTVKLEFLDSEFPRSLVYWALRAPQYRTYCRSHATGTTNLGLAREDFLAYRLPAPTSDALSSVETLEAISDRIDNLSKTNITLEAIASALYKSWFVDFDGLTVEDMYESELGLIPKGWREFALGDLAELGKTSVDPSLDPGALFHHYSLPAFDAAKMPVVELGGAIRSNKTKVHSNSVLVSKLNPHIPRNWFVGTVGDNAVCSTEFLVWTPKLGIGSAFVYCVVASEGFRTIMQGFVTGTSNSHQRVRPNQLASVLAVAANEEAMVAFNEVVSPLLLQVEHNRRQMSTLETLRDTLLPKLIGGSIRVDSSNFADHRAR